MLHKETHEFNKKGQAYKLTATVQGKNGAYYINLTVKDLEPIISKFAHYRTGEEMKLTRYERWSLRTDTFYDLAEAKAWTAKGLNRIIEQFDSGANPRWEQEF